VGNFETRVQAGENSHLIQHGIAIMATGGQAAGTEEYLYGKHQSVTRWHDLENHPEKLSGAGSVVFIQCVGSRDEKRPYCSRICCSASVSQAIAIKEKQPQTDVFVIYRDIRTFGEREILYKKAREKGVIFIRYSLAMKPVVTETPDGLQVRVFDPILQKELLIHADLVNLATAIEPSPNADIAAFYKVPVNAENFFMEAHAKLRPVDFASDGLFVCAIIQEDVDGKGYKAKNISASCKGCGLCAASCPKKAIDMLHFRDDQIIAAVCAAV
jgi:heterodisulfide reductase subunit A